MNLQHNLIDEDDDLDTCDLSSVFTTRAFRAEMIDAAHRVLREKGYPVEPHYGPLCQAFIDGKINLEELSRAIMAPYLH